MLDYSLPNDGRGLTEKGRDGSLISYAQNFAGSAQLQARIRNSNSRNSNSLAGVDELNAIALVLEPGVVLPSAIHALALHKWQRRW